MVGTQKYLLKDRIFSVPRMLISHCYNCLVCYSHFFGVEGGIVMMCNTQTGFTHHFVGACVVGRGQEGAYSVAYLLLHQNLDGPLLLDSCLLNVKCAASFAWGLTFHCCPSLPIPPHLHPLNSIHPSSKAPSSGQLFWSKYATWHCR